MTPSKVEQALAAVSDRDLLAMIRSGSVAALSAVALGAGYWERDTALRAEARRRGLL